MIDLDAQPASVVAAAKCLIRLGFTEHMTWAIAAAKQIIEESDAATFEEFGTLQVAAATGIPLVPITEDDRQVIGDALGSLFLRDIARREPIMATITRTGLLMMVDDPG